MPGFKLSFHTKLDFVLFRTKTKSITDAHQLDYSACPIKNCSKTKVRYCMISFGTQLKTACIMLNFVNIILFMPNFITIYCKLMDLGDQNLPREELYAREQVLDPWHTSLKKLASLGSCVCMSLQGILMKLRIFFY